MLKSGLSSDPIFALFMSQTTTAPQLENWTRQQVVELFELPFNDLMFKAMTVHRENHDANTVQLSTLLSIKTGACPEDCAYCPQSARYKTGLKTEKLMPLDQIREPLGEVQKTPTSNRFPMRSEPSKTLA